jgi:gamma-butyrobetaine dioxygenase
MTLPIMQILKSETLPGLELRHSDGRSMAIHPLWLRERCGDAAHVDERTGQRLYNPNTLPESLAVVAVRRLSDEVWQVDFSDGVTADFHVGALASEAADAAAPALPDRIAWDATLDPIPLLAWQGDYAADAFLAQVEQFLKYGFVILRGVPTRPGSLLDVARRFGFPRETNFGLLFEVRSVPEANDLAYTGLALDAHTDNPYRDPVPGVQLLHCLINESSGGMSTLVDGYAVAEALRAADPEGYRILAETPVRFVFQDSEGDYTDYAPILEHDHAGRFTGIRFSPRLDFAPLLEPAALDRFYAARRRLDAMLRSAAFEIRFLLQAGDLVMFDNRRLLHGRTAFDPQSGLRHLQGCYIDKDAIESHFRVLSRKRINGVMR